MNMNESAEYRVKVEPGFTIQIPNEFLDKAGLKPGDQLDFVTEGDQFFLVKH